ncbi:MAG: hypothetical protein FJ146_07430 [Deltaproteobacteria bacterium]|nr:hypothetical protein [Deltaproteobacteria bacterium]
MIRNICNSFLLGLCGIFFIFPELSAALVSSDTDVVADIPLTESYEFIRLLPGGRYEAEVASDSRDGVPSVATAGQWGTADDQTFTLVDEVSGRSEVLKRLPSIDLNPVIGKTLTTDRAEEISDQGPLSFRSIKLKADGRFVATDFLDGHKIRGKYELGLKAIYDRLEDDGELEHVLMNAIVFQFSGKHVVMTLTLNVDGQLTLEDPMAYGNYPQYHQ